jgi:hypothetical protein
VNAGFDAFIFRTVRPTTPDAVRLAARVMRLLVEGRQPARA